jgi:hypothetical protein
MEQYEIVSLGEEEYLSFVLTVVQRAHAFDEAILFEKVEIGLRLMPDHPDSLTEFGNIYAAVVLTVIVLAAALATMWIMLPLHITKQLQGFEASDVKIDIPQIGD